METSDMYQSENNAVAVGERFDRIPSLDYYNNIEIEIVSGQDACSDPEFLALRKLVYADETGFLPENEIIDTNDLNGQHLFIRDRSRNQLIATTSFIDAIDSDFSVYSGISRDRLKDCYYASRSIVHPDFRQLGLLKLLLYIAMRENRIKGKTYMLSYNEFGEKPAFKILSYSTMEKIKPRLVAGKHDHEYMVYACYCHIDQSMHKTFEKMNPTLKKYVRTNFFANEIEQTVRETTNRFYGNDFFMQVYAGNLNRQQYIAMLSDKYQFVKWTTRLLGHAIAMSDDPVLRKHYVHHLTGEVDHEVLIERDLRYLGADVEYVINGQNPSLEIQEFMSIQESLAGFHRDPVIFLAVPFAAESITAFMPKAFIEKLEECIKSWGIKNPKKAVSFLSSHIHTDGADDGHWNATKSMIGLKLETEKQLQQMVNVTKCIMKSFDRSYTSYIQTARFLV